MDPTLWLAELASIPLWQHQPAGAGERLVRAPRPHGCILPIVYGGGNDLLAAVGRTQAPAMMDAAVAFPTSIVADPAQAAAQVLETRQKYARRGHERHREPFCRPPEGIPIRRLPAKAHRSLRGNMFRIRTLIPGLAGQEPP
ncbi:hypothetical protein [Microvirga makkahensis]|uniref:Uncharacterized protein n=1 Tax=Microvirga makkahensis TaxID=1128670 RepID=A0A7X3SRX4_9HYPH|nr:hypothetical protein [Microvirga makkahensis]MXQ14808.1 hypothetical protein [Microvirga makkahensis]